VVLPDGALGGRPEPRAYADVIEHNLAAAALASRPRENLGIVVLAAGHRDRAEDHYVRAIELARTSGATFVVGVATVGC